MNSEGERGGGGGVSLCFWKAIFWGHDPSEFDERGLRSGRFLKGTSGGGTGTSKA